MRLWPAPPSTGSSCAHSGRPRVRWCGESHLSRSRAMGGKREGCQAGKALGKAMLALHPPPAARRLTHEVLISLDLDEGSWEDFDQAPRLSCQPCAPSVCSRSRWAPRRRCVSRRRRCARSPRSRARWPPPPPLVAAASAPARPRRLRWRLCPSAGRARQRCAWARRRRHLGGGARSAACSPSAPPRAPRSCFSGLPAARPSAASRRRARRRHPRRKSRASARQRSATRRRRRWRSRAARAASPPSS